MILGDKDKELLVKDLCARLPYGVKCKDININVTGTLSQIGLHYNMCVLDKDDGESESCYLLNCKPYLFPLSSMTEEQKEEYYGTFSLSGDFSGSVDFYKKHHFDWRGLIPMDLAIDATNKDIY